MTLTNIFTNIANAIRSKNPSAGKMKPEDMAIKIALLPTEEVEVLPDEVKKLTGNCAYKFYGDAWKTLWDKYSNQMYTEDLGDIRYMFSGAGALNPNSVGYNLTEIPFVFKFKQGVNSDWADAFYGCSNLTTPPVVEGTFKITAFNGAFETCSKLTDLPDSFINSIDLTSCTNTRDAFNSCISFRRAPVELFRNLPAVSSYTSTYYNAFRGCSSLDEIVDMPMPYTTLKLTSNAFGSAFNNLYMLKRLTFALQEDGSPYVQNWSKQTIDLSSYVGYSPNNYWCDNTNTTITQDKQVGNDLQYANLKDDPDYFATTAHYSKYNLASAIETISTLPDCSQGSNNVIKFKQDAGLNTDGGKIHTDNMTEAIALASSRGWTVSFA